MEHAREMAQKHHVSQGQTGILNEYGYILDLKIGQTCRTRFFVLPRLSLVVSGLRERVKEESGLITVDAELLEDIL